MSDQPETLAAVLAEFRAFALRAAEEDKMISPESVLLLADKAETAVERERNAHKNDIHDALYKATGIPGNAAALREALANVERVAKYCAETPRHTPGYPTDAARADVLYSRIAELGRVARAALSAPARNCDRFATADKARAAFEAEHSRGIVRNLYTATFDWLFARAEGGGHA